MNKIGLFPGSFDPFTRGHQHIVNQALTLFDVVVVAVGNNPKKEGMLSVEMRQKLIEDTFAGEPRVVVGSYTSLTVELCQKMGASHIIRGLRGGSDLEMESQNQAINQGLAPGVSTVCFMAPLDMLHISSSAVRELFGFGHNPAEMLPVGIRLSDYL